MASTSVLYNIVARDNASKTFNKVGDSSSRLEKGLGRLGSALKTAAIGMGVADLAAAASVKAAADFQTQMTRVRTGAGELAGNMKLVGDGVLKMAGEVGQSTTSLTSGLYTVESAGFHGAQGLTVLRAASMGAKVGAADLATTTDAVTTALNAYGLGAGSATKVTNAMIATEGAGKTTLEALAGSLSNVLPTAAAAHVGLNEVLGAMATMTAQGTPATQAATYLKQVIGQLSNPSAKAADEMRSLGLSSVKVGQELGKRGLAATLTTLTDAIKRHMGPAGTVLINQLESASKNTSKYQKVLANLNPTQQTYIGALATMVGGTRSMQAALELAGPHMKTFQKNTDTIAQHVAKGGGKIEGWNDVQKTFNQRLAEAKDGLQAMAIKVGTAALPALSRLVGGLSTSVIPEVSKFAGFLTHTAVPAVGRFGASLTDRFIPVGAIKRDLSAATANVGGFLAGISGKSAQVTVVAHHAPIEVPQSAGAKLGAQTRQMFSGGITAGLKAVKWGSVGKVVATGLGDALGAMTSIGSKIAKVLGGIDWVNLGKSVGEQAIPFVIGFVDNLFTPLFTATFWKKHWSDALLFAISVFPVGKVFDGIGTVIGKVPWGKLGEVFEKIPWGKILNWAKPLADGIGGAAKGAGKWVGDLLGAVGDWFARKFPALATWVGEQFLLLPVRIGDVGRVMSSKIAKMFDDMGKTVARQTPGLFRALVRSVAKVFGRYIFWHTGVNLVEGLFNGIVSGLAGGYGWVKRHIADPFIGWVKHLFGVHSPSTVFAGIGGFLVDGLLGGILAGVRGVGGWLGAHVVHPVVGRFSGAASWLASSGGHLIGGLKNGIVDAMKGIGGWIKGSLVDPVVNAVKHWFGIHSPSTVFAELGGHLTGGLLKGMASKGGAAIARLVFGDLPHALEHIVGKGLVSLGSLPGRALKALGGLGGKILSFLGLGGGSSGGAQALGRTMAAGYGWTGGQWGALRSLWQGESGWNPKALNRQSGAFGIPQALPASKMASAGADWRTDAATQIKWGLRYIHQRYGTPAAAYSAWLSRSPHWYAAGTPSAAPGWAVVGERGPELVQFRGGERVMSHARSQQALAPQVTLNPTFNVRVYVGDQELTDLVRVEVEAGHEELAAALGAGPGWG